MITSFTVSARRVVNVAKYESFEFGLTMEVQPDESTSVREQVEKMQRAVRQSIDKEVERLVSELHLEGRNE